MKTLQPATWPRPKGYSNGISATGRMIFTAGVIGWNEQEFLVSHRLDGQFAQALRNILAILAEDGAGPEHIVRLTIYVTEIQEYISLRDELAPIWKSIMGSNYPAMALIEVKRLVDEGYADARRILTEHHDEFVAVAEALLEFETLTGEEIRDLIAGKRPSRDLDDTPHAPRGSAVPSAGKGRKRGEPDAGMEPQPQV